MNAVTLITGASQGIGAATARLLALQGLDAAGIQRSIEARFLSTSAS